MRDRYGDMSGQDEEKLKNQRKVFELDRTLMQVTYVLIDALEEENSESIDDEVHTLAVRLLTKIAVLTKNAECFLMVSYYLQKFQVDVTHELKPLLSEAEHFTKPEVEVSRDELDPLHMTMLREKCAMLDSDDLTCQISLSYDAFATDKNFFYNYCEFRGLTKAQKG